MIKHIQHLWWGAIRQYVLSLVLQYSKKQQPLSKDFCGLDACQWDWRKVENKMIVLQTDLP